MARKAKAAPRIYVLAGVNGAGQSRIGGAMLRAAGFAGVSLFYAGLSFRGWVAYAE